MLAPESYNREQEHNTFRGNVFFNGSGDLLRHWRRSRLLDPSQRHVNLVWRGEPAPTFSDEATFETQWEVGDPSFIDPAAGDYRQAEGSPFAGYGLTKASPETKV